MSSAQDLFKAQTKSVYELFTSPPGIHYYIPAYQRPYSWGKPEIQRLVEDCAFGLRNVLRDHDGYSFVGTVITIVDTGHETIHPMVKADLPAIVHLVIDGQQRMTSISMLLLHLHNRLRLSFKKNHAAISAISPEMEQWISRQVFDFLDLTATTLIAERSNFPAPPAWYPKIIRAYLDSWVRNPIDQNYKSPIAKAITDYHNQGGFKPEDNPSLFLPSANGVDADEKFRLSFKYIKDMVDALMDDGLGSDSICIPSYGDILESTPFQALFKTNKEELFNLFPDRTLVSPCSEIIRILGLLLYFLTRVSVTSVTVSKDEYAFAVFDSLNTTGKPLTPYETLRPIVMKSVGLSNFDNSLEKGLLDEIDANIGDINDKASIKRSEVVAVDFASAEAGEKISKRPDEQRGMYRSTFSRVDKDSIERQAYLRQLRDIVELHRRVFGSWKEPLISNGIFTELSNEGKTCLSFLAKFAHTITIPVLSRFITFAKETNPNTDERRFAVKELDEAIKAITAFSLLFRSTRRDTGGIDDIYRQIMRSDPSSPTSLAALQRSKFTIDGQTRDIEIPTALKLKKELWRRLSDSKPHAGVSNKNRYVEMARDLPIYSINKDIARFLLLIAQHNASEDQQNKGLIKSGLLNCFPCITLLEWTSEGTNSVEHIAPQNPGINGWNQDIYEDQDFKHTLGNLTLCPSGANAALSNRPWSDKKKMFEALSSDSITSANLAIEDIYIDGPSRTKFLQKIRYVPYLKSLSTREDNWDKDFIKNRSECLYGRVWDQLASWLN